MRDTCPPAGRPPRERAPGMSRSRTSSQMLAAKGSRGLGRADARVDATRPSVDRALQPVDVAIHPGDVAVCDAAAARECGWPGVV